MAHVGGAVGFLQAEDGIRDLTVTGVQTCALPIFHDTVAWRSDAGWLDMAMVRPGRLVIAELKTMRGKLSLKQREWLIASYTSWRCDGPYVWDPSCWNSISPNPRPRRGHGARMKGANESSRTASTAGSATPRNE